GREGRRHLFNLAGEIRQDGLDLLRDRAFIARAHHLAFGIVSVRLDAPADREPVGLLALDGEGAGLRRFTQRDRKYAGRQWIKRTGVTSLLRVVEVLDRRDSLRRGHANRLVENKPAVNGIAFLVARHVDEVSSN